MLCLPGSVLLAEAAAAGLAPVPEGFADRGYRADGSLVPRGQPGDLLGEEAAARQAVALAAAGDVRSLCLHGDSPAAVRLAERIVRELARAHVELAPFV